MNENEMNEEEFNNILEQVVEEYRDNFDIQEKENGFKYYVYKTTNIENQITTFIPQKYINYINVVINVI